MIGGQRALLDFGSSRLFKVLRLGAERFEVNNVKRRMIRGRHGEQAR